MTLPDALDFDTALAQLCSKEWSPSGTHVATRHSDEVLSALLPASRTSEGRVALGASPGAIENLVCVLRDPLVFHEHLGELAIRLLRNLCARSNANQFRTMNCSAHELILSCIAKRFEFCDVDGSGADSLAVKRVENEDEEDHHRMCLPFFGFATEFLVNFVTGNEVNADLVWSRAFPDIVEKLLTCDNHAAASAAAALVHNCIALMPHRMSDIVTTWTRTEGNSKSFTQVLVRQLKDQGDGGKASEEKFSWLFMIIRRLVEASMTKKCFDALGPSVEQILSSSSKSFSEDQQIFLQVLEASASKSAERGENASHSNISFPEDDLLFIGDLLEAAFLRHDGTTLKILGSIAGSVILISDDSVRLLEMRTRLISVAVQSLRAIAEREEGPFRQADGSRLDFTDDAHITGLKGVMIRAIALCCDLCPDAQNMVRDFGGIPLVLNALSYEKDVSSNPFLREWAILAVRNLTLGNRQNAAEISAFELRGVQTDDEYLNRAGLEAYIDPTSGQPRLRMKPVAAAEETVLENA